MTFKNFCIKKTLPWRQLSFQARSPLFKASFLVMLIIPIWARLTGTDDSNHFMQLLNFLDNKMPSIPDNLLRLFWASFAINIANIAYFFFCPKITRYQNFQHWLDQDEEANNQFVQMKHQKGASKENEIINELKAKYNTQVDQSNFCRTPVRLFISILYIFSALFVVRAILNQVIPVFFVTNFIQLIF